MTDNHPQPNEGFAWVQAPGGRLLVARALASVTRHGFTSREWVLGLAGEGGSAPGWSEVADAMEVAPSRLVRVHQVHGASVLVHRSNGQRDLPDADIIIADDPSAALAVQTADCVPLLIADRRGPIAAAHAGWRGLAARVPSATVVALAREFGTRPADLVVAIGPSIGACCYEVGVDVRHAFVEAGFAEDDLARWFFEQPQPTGRNPTMPALSPLRRPEHWFFDGWAVARHQLEEAGVPASQIHVAELCTASHPDTFCSYRRDGRGSGRVAAAIRGGGL